MWTFRYHPVAYVVRYSASFVLSICRFYWFLGITLSHMSRIKRINQDILKAEWGRPHLTNSFLTASVQSILNFPENYETFRSFVIFLFTRFSPDLFHDWSPMYLLSISRSFFIIRMIPVYLSGCTSPCIRFYSLGFLQPLSDFIVSSHVQRQAGNFFLSFFFVY